MASKGLGKMFQGFRHVLQQISVCVDEGWAEGQACADHRPGREETHRRQQNFKYQTPLRTWRNSFFPKITFITVIRIWTQKLVSLEQLVVILILGTGGNYLLTKYLNYECILRLWVFLISMIELNQFRIKNGQFKNIEECSFISNFVIP